ncbi:MAG: glycosyltransferase [Novosphingobium sp.]
MPPDLLERAGAVFAYADAQVCLGGAMFDFHARSRLFSAGDILLPDSFGIAHIVPEEGCDIRQMAGVDFLAQVHHPDFNGWWCFAFPVDALEKAGLPMPCFIRGDDVEYGYRLKRAGWPTLGWPGLAVWHMPFEAKTAAWHSFYDRRNALFANALHRRVGLRAALGKLIGGFVLHLLRYDYGRVKAMTQGIAGFNRGPGAMERWSHHDHAALIAAVAAEPISSALREVVDKEGAATQVAPQPLSPRRRAITMAVRFAADLLWPWRRTGLAVLAPGRPWRGDLVLRPAHVAETDDQGDILAIYRYRWGASWAATVRCLIALTGLIWHFRRVVPVKRPRRGN